MDEMGVTIWKQGHGVGSSGRGNSLHKGPQAAKTSKKKKKNPERRAE